MSSRSVTLFVVFGLALAGTLWLFQAAQQDKPPSMVADGSGPGGPFALIDHRGRQVTDSDFRGRYLLIYFGYSYCPDICPTELLKMSRALDIFTERGGDIDRIAPLFITIDPERDDVATLARYVAMFHPGLTGLTGTPDAIADVTRSYRIHAARAGEGPDYLMDHSSLILLMDRENRFLDFFSARESAVEIASALKALP